MKHKLLSLAVALVFTAIFSATKVCAYPVDLSTFDLRDDNNIDYSGIDNSSAEITEDDDGNAPISSIYPLIGPVMLLDYDLSIPADALSLTFDYELVVAPYNEDYFDFYFDDFSSSLFDQDQVGGYNNTAIEQSYSDTITMDLTSYVGSTLPLAFALNWGWDDGDEYDSVLTISNVEINPVPEPATLLLLVMGFIGLAIIRKKFAV